MITVDSNVLLSIILKEWRNYLKSRKYHCQGCGEIVKPVCPNCRSAVKFRQRVLTDFLIGGFAQANSDGILTFDTQYYRIYFPERRSLSWSWSIQTEEEAGGLSLQGSQVPKKGGSIMNGSRKTSQDKEIDFSDIPELDTEFWREAKLVRGTKKKAISLRIDQDTLDFFKAQGKGYQSRINDVLRTYVQAKKMGAS